MKSEHNSKRKRRIAESQVDRVEGTSSKRIAQMPLTENAIGWEEAPIPCRFTVSYLCSHLVLEVVLLSKALMLNRFCLDINGRLLQR